MPFSYMGKSTQREISRRGIARSMGKCMYDLQVVPFCSLTNKIRKYKSQQQSVLSNFCIFVSLVGEKRYLSIVLSYIILI